MRLEQTIVGPLKISRALSHNKDKRRTTTNVSISLISSKNSWEFGGALLFIYGIYVFYVYWLDYHTNCFSSTYVVNCKNGAYKKFQLGLTLVWNSLICRFKNLCKSLIEVLNNLILVDKIYFESKKFTFWSLKIYVESTKVSFESTKV